MPAHKIIGCLNGPFTIYHLPASTLLTFHFLQPMPTTNSSYFLSTPTTAQTSFVYQQQVINPRREATLQIFRAPLTAHYHHYPPLNQTNTSSQLQYLSLRRATVPEERPSHELSPPYRVPVPLVPWWFVLKQTCLHPITGRPQILVASASQHPRKSCRAPSTDRDLKLGTLPVKLELCQPQPHACLADSRAPKFRDCTLLQP